jgi:aromatic-L-amino-acid/L-tryptophan decarboxylase
MERVVEENLDPKDWREFEKLSHQMLDDMVQYIKTLRDQPVWKPPSSDSKRFLTEALPTSPAPLEQVYQEFKEHILPFTNGNIHPRFWGWVQGTGTMTGVVAEMLASTMNPSTSFGNHADILVERQVVNWAKEIFEMPQEASGLLTTGGSTANLLSLAVGRNSMFPEVRTKGMKSLPAPLTVYASTETHSCLDKSIEMLGIGRDYYRKIPVDDNYQIRVDDLNRQIENDRKLGFIPFCIIGNAGTVSTGSIDNLMELSLIAKRERMWYHIDGAFGAVPRILPDHYNELKAIEYADSLAFDFHKWFYINYDACCFLIRDGNRHKEAFAYTANYLLSHDKGIMAGDINPHQLGIELSRGFRSLKVWMNLKQYGIETYRRLVRQNLDQAQFLGDLITRESELQLMAPIKLNIVCYRFNPKDSNDANELNKQIVMRLHEDGIAAPSFTLLKGQYCIRVAITNHRSTRQDFVELVKNTIRIGRELTKRSAIIA